MDTLMKSKGSDEPQIIPSELVLDVEDATNKDHELTILQAFKIYPKAVAWSAVLSASCIMDGYDTKLIGSLFAQPAFCKAYGELQPDGTYQITAAWQSGLNNGSNCGQMIGLCFAGFLTERFGFRKTMIATLLVIPCIIFIQFFAPNLTVLEVGQILLGIPLGVFETITCVYAVEVAPTCLRGILTSWVSQNWVIGQLISAIVLRAVLYLKSSWAYRIPFAIQWFWAVLIFIAVLFAPESPWWLVRQHRPEEAKVALRRLTSGNSATDFSLQQTLTLMELTLANERKLNPSTTFAACFKGTDLRRTMIVIGCYCMQIISGTTLRAYSTYFFEQAGLSTEQAFNMSIVTYVLEFVGTVIAWFLMPYVGRRTLFLWGLSTITAIFFTLGGLGVPQSTTTLSWAIASLLIACGFVGYLCMEPAIFAVVSEIPSSLLRSKSVAIARFSYAALNIGATVLTSYQLNPSAWGWGAKSGFFWGVSCMSGIFFTYFFVPEAKDRTVAELDLLFEKGVSARKFASTQVHAAEVAERAH
ncbi:hypothetical protein B7463_g11614, partial [Scytalidium lignicola]